MKHAGDTENSPDGLGILTSAYDWQEAMKYAKFSFKDIEKVIFEKEGENDGVNGELVVKLKTGEDGWLSAWCDASGWGCQAGGSSGIEENFEDAQVMLKKECV